MSQLRAELMREVEEAIRNVREKVIQLSEDEKEYLRFNSPEYLKLVETIRDWYKV